MVVSNTIRQRALAHKRAGTFKSGKEEWDNRDTAKKVLLICSKIVWDKYYQDDLKAPLGNPAKPASISPASMNFYFGTNVSKAEEWIERTAYAVGTGTYSIGLNPITRKVHSIFHEMSQLMALVNSVVRKKPSLACLFTPTQYFNHCSVKIYFTYRDLNGDLKRKQTDWHTDVSYDKVTGEPKPDNSQVAGTPVAIATFGDPKELQFIRHEVGRTKGDPKTLLKFTQPNATLFIMHPADEAIDLNLRKYWKHKSEMCNGPSIENNVTFSFVFRVVQPTVEVNLADDTLVNKECGEERMKRFDAGQRILRTKAYVLATKEIEAKMKSVFERYTSTKQKKRKKM
jgi:hypothetical protein